MTHRSWLGLLTFLMLALAAPRAGAVDPDKINGMVERGVVHLKSLQNDNGEWPQEGGVDEKGSTSLAALTLLECGVPASDPIIQKAAASVRLASVKMISTYSISLAILFLDRLGERADVALIESLAVRLLAGQDSTGGWNYTCPGVSDAETARLLTVVKQQTELKGRTDLPREAPPTRRTVADLPKEIQEQIGRAEAAHRASTERQSDNSNTQFALLALWVSRRHGLPVEGALAQVGQRFRALQTPAGGWAYRFRAVGITPLYDLGSPSMTCAGLLGLAVSFGIHDEPARADKGEPAPERDPKIKTGLSYLGNIVGLPIRLNPKNWNGLVGDGRNDGSIPLFGPNADHFYYFLWSLERVAVIYGLDTIGKKDWYAWGCKVLEQHQGANGSWATAYGRSGVDTCFALLFLRRANVARDLTSTLRGRVTDPGQRELRTGGTSGAALLSKPPSSPADSGTKPRPDAGRAGTTPAETDVDRLGAQFLAASGAEQDALLQKLKSGRGSPYTQALATAIPKLTGAIQKSARQALADRLSDLKTDTLRGYLPSEDGEIRRAAALACAMKDDKTTVPDLIPLLEDPEALVVRAAHAALKSLTSEDFGPAADASPVERARAAEAWKAWWRKNGK